MTQLSGDTVESNVGDVVAGLIVEHIMKVLSRLIGLVVMWFSNGAIPLVISITVVIKEVNNSLTCILLLYDNTNVIIWSAE
jgi:hypothetical protein